MKDQKPSVGDQIRVARLAAGLSRRQLARMASLTSHARVSDAEDGASSQIDTIAAIGHALKVDIVIHYVPAPPPLTDAQRKAGMDAIMARQRARQEAEARKAAKSAISTEEV
jgi:transcriptional regulator with XRE-family HTH domain